MPRKAIPAEALVDLRRRLSQLPPRAPERRRIMQETAASYGVSEPTLYRAIEQHGKPRVVNRADRGQPRLLPKAAWGFCRKVRFLGKIQKSGLRNSTTYRLQTLEKATLRQNPLESDRATTGDSGHVSLHQYVP